MSQEYNVTSVSDEHMNDFLNGVIPVLQDLREICSNWNGDDSGTEETRANEADEIFELLTQAGDRLVELRAHDV